MSKLPTGAAQPFAPTGQALAESGGAPAQQGSAPLSHEDADLGEQWTLVNTPLGEQWSGRTRYAAAMFFHKRGDMDAETLEVYRLCSRLDAEDPVPIIRDRGVGKAWLKRLDTGTAP